MIINACPNISFSINVFILLYGYKIYYSFINNYSNFFTFFVFLINNTKNNNKNSVYSPYN